MRSVREIPLLQNIPVLVRAALNVPVANGAVVNDFRLRRALPTLSYLREQGARIIVISHIGEAGTETLLPVVEALQKITPRVTFCETTIGVEARSAIRALRPGDILVLENLRRNRGEVTNDATFARELSSMADVFVQDSFDTCHRSHASIVGIPEYLPSYAGLLLLDEIKELEHARNPMRPALAIVGCAKFATKEPVLEALLGTYDKVFVGGALANDFLKAKGYNMGRSITSDAPKDVIKKLVMNPRTVLPVDAELVSANKKTRTASISDIHDDEAALDHGPETAYILSTLARESKTVLWNGPLGEYEHGFTSSTDAVAEAIVQSGTYSIVGGGDTVAEIERIGLV